MRWKARRLNEKGLALKAQGRWEEAVTCYEAAIRASPDWAVPWFNLGLVYKHQRQWESSFRFNRKALELDPRDEAARWNLGIAATALGDWPTARYAWRGFGMKIPDGKGPIDENFGMIPIRIQPMAVSEVVWAVRLDPARAMLDSVPLPESHRRWRDLVLNDGEPKGYRVWNGSEVPVLEEIELLAPSSFNTFAVEMSCEKPEHRDALLQTLNQLDEVRAEDWTANVRFICKACSEGRPHAHHSQGTSASAGEWQRDRRLGVAARNAERIRPALDQWSSCGFGSVLSCTHTVCAPDTVA